MFSTLSPVRKNPRPKHPERLPDHRRMRDGKARPANTAERRHMARLAQIPCLGCGARPVELHHSLTAQGKARKRDHRFVVPLCRECHQGRYGVHGIGEPAFGARIGINLGQWSVEQWERSNA